MITVTAREENAKFCIAVGPVTRTVGTLTQSMVLAVNEAGHLVNFGCNLYISLKLMLTLVDSKRLKGNKIPCNVPWSTGSAKKVNPCQLHQYNVI